MDVVWVGHSCFKLKGREVAVITDPFAPSVGFSLPKVEGDIVTVSHQHDDHNKAELVGGEPFIIDSPGEYEIKGVSVFGVGSNHDDQNGSVRGKNTIFLIDVDGVKICHLGDLGHLLTREMVESIGEVHVLLVPVGGFYTIGPKEAAETVKELDPVYVIPMHYNMDELNQDVFGKLAGVDEFLKTLGVEKEIQPKLLVNADRLPEQMRVVVLERR